MGIIVGKYYGQTNGTAAASPTWEAWFDGEQIDGDVIVIVASNDGGGTVHSCSGWTQIGAQASSAGVRTSIWYQVRSGGTDIEEPTLTGTSDEWACTALLLRGLDAADPINASAQTNQTTNTYTPTCPDATTDEDHCFVLRVVSRDACTASPNSALGTYRLVAIVGDNSASSSPTCGHCIVSQYAPTAGALGTFQMGSNGLDGGRQDTIAFNLDAATPVPTHFKSVSDVVVFYSSPVSAALTSAANLNTLVATLDSITVQNGTASVTAISQDGLALSFATGTIGPYVEMRCVQATSPNGPAGYYGVVADLPASVDFENKLFCCQCRSGTDAQRSTDRPVMLFFDSSGNWAAIQPLSRVEFSTWRALVMNLPDMATLDGSATPVDWSDITKIGCAKYATDSLTSSRTHEMSFRALLAIPFGTQFASIHGVGITATDISDLLYSMGAGEFSSLQGGVQVLAKLPFQIGDLTTPAEFDALGVSVAYPSNQPGYFPADHDIAIKVAAGASDAINLSALTIASQGKILDVDWDASSDGDGVDGTATVYIGTCTTLAPDVPIVGATFADCCRIYVNGGTLTDCTISSSINTTAAVTATDGANITGCAFTKGAESYAIQFDGNGPATLDVSGCTFSGYTYDLNLTGTTGTVTITLAVGQAQPTYQTAGIAVAWDQEVPGTTWTNEDLADGTTILVVNTTTATTIAFTQSLATGTGYTISLVPGTDYTVDDIIEVRQSRQSGTDYYEERTSRIITTDEGGSIVEADALADCTVCNDLGFDGSDYDAVFELDSTDDELDIVTAGEWQAGWLMAWWKWKMTDQDAMEEFWGAWTVQEDGSFKNSTAILSSQLDTTETGDSVETTGRRIWRDDGERPIKSPTTSGYAIDCAWREPVTLVSVGSGVLPADISAIGAEVATRSQAGEVHADVRWVNDISVGGSGTTGDEWGPA